MTVAGALLVLCTNFALDVIYYIRGGILKLHTVTIYFYFVVW